MSTQVLGENGLSDNLRAMLGNECLKKPRKSPAVSMTELEKEEFHKITMVYSKAVCQIQVFDSNDNIINRGTGCVIEGGLVITNYHVVEYFINNRDKAKIQAAFFRATSQTKTMNERSTTFKIIELSLDPSRYLFWSPNNNKDINGKRMEVDSDHLDFAIISLSSHSFSQIPKNVFSIFETCVSKAISDKNSCKITSHKIVHGCSNNEFIPEESFSNQIVKEETPIRVIQYPEDIDEKTATKGTLKIAEGNIQKDENPKKHSIHYYTDTNQGSSGGAIIDFHGNFIALHYQNIGSCGCNAEHTYCKSGVLISRIRDCLKNTYDAEKSQEQKIQELIADEQVYKKTELDNLLFDKLKEFYCSQAEIETLIEERTLSIEDIYVRLALIKEEKEKKDKEKKDGKIQQTPEDNRWPTYETIYDPKESIKLEEIFKHEKLKQKKEKRIIVWGAAGAGKSTCLHHIAHEWANKRLWNEFKAVFWICLRNLNANYYPPLRRDEEKYDAYYLIARECNLLSKEHNLDLSTLRSLLADEEFCNNTLLVLDGYDELPYIADRGHLANAFKQLKKIFPHILISSRPQSVTFIQNPVEIEILGFDRKGVDQYIEKFHDQISKTSELSSEKLQSKLKSLRYLLKQKPLINSLSCIPINLELLCCLYFFEEEIDANAFTTITSLYSHIIDWLCKRFLLRRGISEVSSADICELENICDHSKISPLISILTEVAWYAMGENTLYFPQNKIKVDLFNSIRALGLLKIKNRMANFIHSTFQEYFAAVYLASYYIQGKSKEAKKNIAKNKLIPRYKLVFEMTAGYLSLVNERKALQKFFKDLLLEPYDLAVNYELNLLARCFEECKVPSIMKQYSKFIEFVVDYIKDNWFVNSHSIAQLLTYNPCLLNQEKVSQVILEVLTKCEKIILCEQAHQEFSRLEKDIIDNSSKLNELNVKDIRVKVIDFIAEILQADQKFYIKVEEILINAINIGSQDVKNKAVLALGEICRSERCFKKTLKTVTISLVWIIRNSDECVRSIAAKFLGEICQSKQASKRLVTFVKQALIEALDNSAIFDYVVIREALSKICSLDKNFEKKSTVTVTDLVKKLGNADEDMRMSAANALEEMALLELGNVPKTQITIMVKTLTNSLKDADKHVRGRVAAALSAICRSEKTFEEIETEKIATSTVKALIEALKDIEEYVRSNAADALGNICRPQKVSGEIATDVVKALTNALKDIEEYVRSNAADALGKICLSYKISEETLTSVLKTLTEALTDIDEYVRSNAVKALVEICKSVKISEEILMAVLGHLFEALNNTDEYVRSSAVKALGEICKSVKISKEILMSVLEHLFEALNNTDEYVQIYVSEALSKIMQLVTVSDIQRTMVTKILTNAMRNENKDIRFIATSSLGNICQSEDVSEKIVIHVINLLTEALYDKDAYVRDNAAKALCNIAQADKVFSKLVLKHINIGDWLKNKRDIDCLLKNANLLNSLDTFKYAIRLCNNTNHIFSFSKKKIFVAGKKHPFKNSQLSFEELKEADVFDMILWRK